MVIEEDGNPTALAAALGMSTRLLSLQEERRQERAAAAEACGVVKRMAFDVACVAILPANCHRSCCLQVGPWRRRGGLG